MPEILGGKYVLERIIGRGGMGIVRAARDVHLGRRVAIKIVAPERTSNPNALARFEHEARAIARLQNAHVVQIHDYGIEDGAPFIVMELLEGDDLESRLTRVGRLPFDVVARLLRQAARGLGAAHAAGLVHCDLKPANLFLSRGDDGEEVLKILDFGVATMLVEPGELTQWSGFAGTPAYMSPEQLRASTPDHRSDLWSLGVLTYQMLTGHLPFEAPGFGQLLMRVCGEPFEPPTSLVPGLPPGIDDFFARALAKDPTQRFQSAAEFAAAFVAASKAARPIKVLVVDDEKDMSELFKQAFRSKIRSSAYEFFFASDGESALAELGRRADIDLVLTDINMPGMDGLTLLQRIGEVRPDVKAVVLTAYGDMSNIRAAMNRGAFDFLVKPIDFDDLEVTIEKTFRQVEQSRKSAISTQENELFRMLVSPLFVERLRLLGPAGALACDTRDATVAFIEVCGADAWHEDAPPDDLVRMLNANHEFIVPEVLARGGIVDRFLGHGVMAFFHGPEHVERALDACTAVRGQLEDAARRAGEDSPYAAGIRVGIASGRVHIAGIGSRSFARIDYLTLGEVAAAAVRLADSAARGQVLIDPAVDEATGGALNAEDVGPRVLRPGAAPVRVRNVLGRKRPTIDIAPVATTVSTEIGVFREPSTD
jgi:CheY-like chemotaxis protein